MDIDDSSITNERNTAFPTKTNSAKKDHTKFEKVSTKKLLFIEYPGYIQNVDRMLETLGGEQKLSEIYFKTKIRLPLTYRPEDLNAHYVCADLLPFTGLLMKVKRRKVKKHLGTEAQENESKRENKQNERDIYEYKQEIVGIVKQRYVFQSLMDYQYLTPESHWNYFKTLRGTELSSTPMPPYFAPATFARLDRHMTYDYKPDLTTPKVREENYKPDMMDREKVRKRRHTESMAALFTSIEIPKKPSNKTVEYLEKLMDGPEKDNIELIGQLFKERPLWSKLAIRCKVNMGPDKFKRVLAYFSYYWLSGPWRTMWCRMGFDPRKEPTAKIYQMIDYRVRDSKENRHRYKALVPRRSHKNYVPMTLRSISTRASSGSVLSAFKEPSEKDEEDREPYIFHPDKMVSSRSIIYQLCDIFHPEVEKIIHENDGIETNCGEREGWFPQGTMNRIRNEMNKSMDIFFNKQMTIDKTHDEGEISSMSADDTGTKQDQISPLIDYVNSALPDDYEEEQDLYSEEESVMPGDYEQFSYTRFLQQSLYEEDGETYFNDDY